MWFPPFARLSALGFASLPIVLLAAQGKGEPETPKPYKITFRVQGELVLEDLQGQKVSLFEEAFTKSEEGKVVAIVFWSLHDPQCQAYRARLEQYAKDFPAPGVRLFLVASSYDEIFSPLGDPLEKFREFVTKEKFALPLLIDRGNRIADDFGALTANHAFLVDRQRYVRYIGGIDDDPRGERPETVRPWLRRATEALLAGQKIADPLTRPVGRKIKRAPKVPPAGKESSSGGSPEAPVGISAAAVRGKPQ
ncbi:MAG: redoxin domain-containing protein [Planctomycetota bacterium]